MGFRYRKSINLGGGFRINLSKSGIGYSWGAKGYRVTKKAGGGSRTTASIPGTGISYTKDYGGKSRSGGSSATPSRQNNTPVVDNNHYDTQEIKNANAKTLVSEGLEDMLESANKALSLWSTKNILFWVSLIGGCAFPLLWLGTAACIFFHFYLKKNAVIDLEYTFEDDQATEVAERMAPLTKIANSKKLWWISQTSKVIDTKYSGGASSSVKRQNCVASTKVPFPFTSNAKAVAFKSGKETLLFLPDKLFIIQGSKIGALNYSDVTTSVHGQRFVEREAVPSDSQIVDYTWQYVNKSGGPDKRFQNNRKIPICLYGEMEIRSANGVNTDIMFSNPNIQ